MDTVKTTYNERVSDIEAHFDLIKNISDAVASGGAKLTVNSGYYTITIQQQKILFSSTCLQLYNLVEATVNELLCAVGRNSQNGINGDLTKLSNNIRDLYLKHMIPAEGNITPEKHLERAVELLHQAVGKTCVEIKIPRGGGGNWDIQEIKNLSKRIGIDFELPENIYKKVSRPFRNEQGPLRYIKDVRNNLAHGSISFSDCGAGHSYSEFRALIDIVKEYLEFLISEYESYIDNARYLAPA